MDMDELLENEQALDNTQEFLIFTVDAIDFGIDIGLVQEIIKIQPISTIPNALPFCKGIINIRGTIVPVIDMRAKLGFQPGEYNERTCIIVVLLGSELVGFIVDMVKDVMRIPQESLSDSPTIHAGDHRSYTSKIANVDGKIKQILNVDAVFGLNVTQ